MSRFHPKRQVIAQAFVWQRGKDGRWERYMVREQRNTSPSSSQLARVPANVPVCMACLSAEVDILPSDAFEAGELHCRACGVSYGFIV